MAGTTLAIAVAIARPAMTIGQVIILAAGRRAEFGLAVVTRAEILGAADSELVPADPARARPSNIPRHFEH